MAKDDIEKKPGISKTIQQLATNIQNSMDRLYTNTYFNTPTNNRSLNVLKKDIDTSINNIFDGNMDKVGIPNISSLYKRLSDLQSDPAVQSGIEDLFSDKNTLDAISSLYTQNMWIKDMREEIDIICKYMPKLEEALQVRKDNVLSADYFNKDFIFVSSRESDNEEMIFSKRINELKDKYDLINKVEEYYDETAKYGEQFIYCVPYERALAKLLQNKPSNPVYSSLSLKEGAIIEESGIQYYYETLDESVSSIIGNTDQNMVHIELCRTNVLEDAVTSMKTAKERLVTINEMALNYITEETKTKFDKPIIDDDLEFDDFNIDAQDGFIGSKIEEEKRIKITTPGAVLKELDAMGVIPIYIDSLCMGYYYIEITEYDKQNTLFRSNPSAAMKSSRNGVNGVELDAAQNDNVLKYISGNLSKYIDAKFVNANQDLRKEIYMILKHNELMNDPSNAKIKVTFLPPEDVIHMHFKLDKKTHHGISDLENALLPAKLYISLLIGNILAILTRSQDKRVYYVKQNVETNIAKNLINVMNQVKKGNMGIRQIENINNVLNISGRFNDYLIPVGPSGDPAISFEVMQGQQVDIKTELMNMLEEMAVNTTDVPIELIQARQSIDYAIQLTMQNSKFLRKVFNRQAKFQPFCSDLLTKLYNAEYGTNIRLEVNLPAPLFISMTNTNQIIANNREYVQSIVDIEMADETDEVTKAIFTKLMTRQTLATYLDLGTIETLKSKAKQERQAMSGSTEENALQEAALIKYYNDQRSKL